MNFSILCATMAVGQAPTLPAIPLDTTPRVVQTTPTAKAPQALQMGKIPLAQPVQTPAPMTTAPAAPATAEEPKKEEEKKEEEKFFIQKYLESTPFGASMADKGWKIYGWTQGSYTYSTARNSTLPVPFIDRANKFSLNQNWLHIEKSIDTDKKEFQIGGVVEGLWASTDSRFTYARNLFDGQNAQGVVNGHDIYQMYADLYLPNLGGSGTTLRLGKFATFLEYEVVQGTQNPFVSRSYLFQYNPFTHTGGMATTAINDDWTMINGVVLGNDNFIDRTSTPTYIGQLKWAPKEGKSSLALGTSIGNASFDVKNAFNVYNVYNLQFTHKLTDKLQYVADTSYSHMDNVPGIGFTNWYGLVNYLLHDVSDTLQSKVRVEMFNDPQGVRTGTAGLYTGVTYGLTWKPLPSLYVMPEVRYDHNSIGRPFEGNQDMFCATLGIIVRY